jgi:sulfur-oxidizing protein SoxY
MNPHRRTALRGTLAASTVLVAAAAGLLRPGRAVAAAPAPPLRDTLLRMSRSQPADNSAIQVKVPDIAADGASVFMEVICALPHIDTLAILVERNPQPLIAAFRLGPDTLPWLMTRIKVAQTSPVWVIAHGAGRFHKGTRVVQVTVGGCGAGVN